MKKRKNAYIALRVSDQKKEILAKEAEKQGLYLSELIEKILDRWMKKR